MLELEDDEEKRRRMLSDLMGSQGGGFQPADVDQPDDAAPMSLRAPDPLPEPSQPAAVPMYPGYTPPPPASSPNYLAREDGYQFGVGDVASIVGILGSLLAKKPGLAAHLTGAYGGAVMGAQQGIDRRNAQVDQYNAKLAERDNPFERWKSEQEAIGQAGNLAARNRGLDLQQKQFEGAEARAAAEAQRERDMLDPNSDAYKNTIKRAEALEGVKTKGALERAQGESDIDFKRRKMLGELAAKFKGGGSAKPRTPKQEYDDELYKRKLEALKNPEAPGSAGTDDIDPATGKPWTQAALEKKRKRESGDILIPGTIATDQAAYRRHVTSSPGNLAKLEGEVATSQQVLDKLAELEAIRGEPESLANRDRYTSIMNFLIGDQSKAGSTGVLSGTEYERYLKPMAKYSSKDSPGRQVLNADGIIDKIRTAKDVYYDHEDPDAERLRGLDKAFRSGASAKLRTYGIDLEPPKPKGSKAPADKQQSAAPDGITLRRKSDGKIARGASQQEAAAAIATGKWEQVQ